MLNKINAIKSELKSDIIDILRGIPDFKITPEHSIDGTLPSCVVYNDEPCDGEMYGKYNCEDKTVYILVTIYNFTLKNLKKYYKIEVETEIHSGYYYIKYNDNSINTTL